MFGEKRKLIDDRPRETPPPQYDHSDGRTLVSPELSIMKESEADSRKKPEPEKEHTWEKQRDEYVWKLLNQADAALAIEKYFRAWPKNPSLRDILLTVNLPPNTVNKEFLRLCSSVAEKYRTKISDVDSVMQCLRKEVGNVAQETPEVLGAHLYRHIAGNTQGALYPGMTLRRVGPYIFLSIENNVDYDMLYGEKTPDEKSGGRFHRAQYVELAGKSIPIIVRRGELVGKAEEDEIMIHEIQHLINEAMVGLEFAESSRPSIFGLPKENPKKDPNIVTREEVLDEEDAQIRIKDEIFAYIRQGRIANVKETLAKKLYANLFTRSEKYNTENKRYIVEVQKELTDFLPFIAKYPRMKELLPYMLFTEPLRTMAKRIHSIRESCERIESMSNTYSTQRTIDISSVICVAPEHGVAYFDGKSVSLRMQDLANECRNVFRGTVTNNAMRSLEDIEKDANRLNTEAQNAFRELRTGFHEGCVPYVSAYSEEGTLNNREHDVQIRAAQHALANIESLPSDIARIFDQWSGDHDDNEADVVAHDAVEGVIDAVTKAFFTELSIHPHVEVFVSEDGIRIKTAHIQETAFANAFVRMVIEVPLQNNVDPGNTIKLPKAMSDDQEKIAYHFYDERRWARADDRKTVFAPSRKYALMVRNIEQIDDVCRMLRRDIRKAQETAYTNKKTFSLLKENVESLQYEENVYAGLEENMTRDGAHIPRVGHFDLYSSDDEDARISNAVDRGLEKFREELFLFSDSIDQLEVDRWILEHRYDKQTFPSAESLIERALQDRFRDGKFGSGKVRSIALDSLEYEQNSLKVTFSCSVQGLHNKWITTKIPVSMYPRAFV